MSSAEEESEPEVSSEEEEEQESEASAESEASEASGDEESEGSEEGSSSGGSASEEESSEEEESEESRPSPKPKKAARKSPSPELLRSGQASPGGSPSSRGGALADGERVLLQGRMSVRISGSPYHVPMMLKITAASDCAQRKEPWTTFSYTSKHESVAVPCRAISAVRIHANDANPSFEIEYSAPRADASPHKEPPAAEGRKTSLPPRVSVRMRVWATSRAQFEEWRTALAPLPLVNVHAMDRARSWLDSHMSELRGLEDQLEDEAEQRRSKKLFDGSV